MNQSANSFQMVSPVLFFILMGCVIVWFALVVRLHRLLRTRHPDVYDALGRPTLILNNSIKNGWLFTRFLLGGHFENIDDGETLQLCRFMRAFAFCYLVLFVALVVFGFASTSGPPTHP
jgi:hypothetical protein